MQFDRLFQNASQAIAREQEAWATRIGPEKIHPLITAGYGSGLKIAFSLVLSEVLAELKLSTLEAMKETSDAIASKIVAAEAVLAERSSQEPLAPATSESLSPSPDKASPTPSPASNGKSLNGGEGYEW